jgi:ribosomal protein L7/L12
MAKREISAKAFVKDFRSGMDERGILGKYSLSQEKLRLILKKLVDAKALRQDEVDTWLSLSQPAGLREDTAESGETPLDYSEPRRLRVSKKQLEQPEPEPAAEEHPSSPASTEVVGYRLKLYGRTANDPDAFSANLAAVLGIDASTARDYLNRVPVTIKEGVSEQKAERLRSILASVGALCLVEPMNGAEQQPPSAAPARETAIADALLMRPEKTIDGTGFLPSSVKPSLLALVGVVVFLCVGGLYLLLATRPAREEMAINAPKEKTTTQDQKAQTMSDEETLPLLKAQITYLEGELPKLNSRLMEEQAGYDLLAKTPGVKFDDLQQKSLAVQEVQEQINTTRWQIQTIKKKVALMERHGPLAEESQSAAQTK